MATKTDDMAQSLSSSHPGLVLAVTNQKGGVSKTTTTVNLASSFAAMQFRVLLIDLDAQCNATTACGLKIPQISCGIAEALLQEVSVEDATHTTPFGFDLIPANHKLSATEVHLLPQTNKEFRLAGLLNSIKDRYDLILIDTPPALNILTINAIVAANRIIIPVQCEYFALEGLAKLLKTIESLKQTLCIQPQILGILRTMYDGRNLLAKQVSDQLQHNFQHLVFQNLIPRNVRLAEAPSHGKPIFHYDKRSQGNATYLALAAEVIRRIPALQTIIQQHMETIDVAETA